MGLYTAGPGYAHRYPNADKFPWLPFSLNIATNKDLKENLSCTVTHQYHEIITLTAKRLLGYTLLTDHHPRNEAQITLSSTLLG
ncbi:hypothetical protein TURU_104965 [Turdus rufiventris]|nr:hypothetical protein TURU_104965 [Turdus rufiventris]